MHLALTDLYRERWTELIHVLSADFNSFSLVSRILTLQCMANAELD
jgi:hypothetical protein